LFVEAGLQAILVQFGGPFTKTTGHHHTLVDFDCLGGIHIPLGVAMRYIPVSPKLSDYAAFFEEEFEVRLVRIASYCG